MNTFDILTRLALPILTFLGGALFTYYLQRRWRSRNLAGDSAKALAELVSDWFNQLDELRRNIDDPDKSIDRARLVDNYVRNRLILPKVLFHLSVLREFGVARELTAAVERFLNQVTMPNQLVFLVGHEPNGSERLAQRFDFSLQDLDSRPMVIRSCRNLLVDAESRLHREKFDELLLELDQSQQIIADHAARVSRG